MTEQTDEQTNTLIAFHSLPLIAKMHAADQVRHEAVKEVRRRLGIYRTADPFYQAESLDYFMGPTADRWEREDAEKAREAQEVEELAKVLHGLVAQLYGEVMHPKDMAWAVLAAGYRKTDQ